jgi:arylsulfatase A-like enzyme
MRKMIKRIIIALGVFLAAGAFGAAWELFLNKYIRLTEPLAGYYWFWSFFHRAKFYAVLGAAAGGAMTLAAAGFAAVWRKLTRRVGSAWRPRAAYAGAFAASLAGTPIWYVLAKKPVELPDTSGPVIALAWFAGLVLATAAIYHLGRITRRVNPTLRVAFAVVGFAGAAAYLAGGVVSAVARPSPPPGLPDVIIITFDACRADELGRRPDGATLTPNLERFAEDAYVFKYCRSQASWTSPSLATLQTGQYPMVHYATAHRPLGTSQPTLAELLRDAGYETKAVVANRLCHRTSGLARGFDDYLYWDQNEFMRRLGYYETYFYYLENRIYEKRNTRVGVKDDHTAVITDHLVRILSEKRRRPLFLWAHYLDPHCPYSPPPQYVAPEDRPFIDKVAHGDEEKAGVLRRLYDGEVRYVDDEFARVWAVLPENALVIISSDHGEEFWEHGGYDHGNTLYEEVIRIPLIVRFPGGRGGTSDVPVGLVDVAPSVLSYLGLDVPPSVQGRDMWVAAQGGEGDVRAFAGSSMLKGQRQYCVIYNGRKLIIGHWDDWSKAKYFDLSEDAGEQNPLSTFDPPRDELENLLGSWVEGNLEFSKRFKRAGVSTAVRDQMRAVGYIK